MIQKITWKFGTVITELNNIANLLHHWAQSVCSMKYFTSSGNSSLTRDMISDVFPTLAVAGEKKSESVAINRHSKLPAKNLDTCNHRRISFIFSIFYILK